MHNSLPREARLPPSPAASRPCPCLGAPCPLHPLSPWVGVQAKEWGNHGASLNLHPGAYLNPAPRLMPFYIRA